MLVLESLAAAYLLYRPDVFCLFTTDSGSVAVYSAQENELLTMNCDIDGTSGCAQIHNHDFQTPSRDSKEMVC